MLPSFNETKYNSHWQLCSLEELGRGKSKHRQGMITDYFWENIPLFRLGTSKLQIFGSVLTNTYNEIGLEQSKLWGKDTLLNFYMLHDKVAMLNDVVQILCKY